MSLRFLGLVIIVLTVGTQFLSPVFPQEVTIEFTRVPQSGSGSGSRGDIEGSVLGLNEPRQYKVVLYAHTDWWYVQPLVSDPYTDIGSDGKWSNWTHLGHRYAALVVRPSFRPEARVQ